MPCTKCQHRDKGYKTVTLCDGRQVCSGCEDFRHECEARMVLARPTTFERREYLDSVESPPQQVRSRCAQE